MKPSLTMKRWVACVGWFALVSIGACAQGSPAKPVNDFEAMPTMHEPACGNGKFDIGMEQCDCPNKMTTTQCTPIDLTCAMVQPGSTGVLFCNAQPRCTLDTSKCVGGTAPPPGASGAPGLPRAATGGGGTGR
jgi:hypothetical protein